MKSCVFIIIVLSAMSLTSCNNNNEIMPRAENLSNSLELLKSKAPNLLTNTSVKFGITNIEIVDNVIEISSMPIYLNNRIFNISDLSVSIIEKDLDIKFELEDGIFILINKGSRQVNVGFLGKTINIEEIGKRIKRFYRREQQSSALGQVDSSCLWEDNFCNATVEIECEC